MMSAKRSKTGLGSGEGTPPTLAERQLANARRDPRLDGGPEAMVVDWWAAVEAAERTRNLSRIAIHELVRAQGEPEVGPEAEARWERAELGRAEVANEFAELNAMTLVSLVSALDAMVQTLTPQAQEMTAAVASQQVLERLRENEAELHDAAGKELLSNASEALRELIVNAQVKPERIGGVGAKRWEVTLAAARLNAPKERPLPEDLDEALTELLAIRHAIVHRGGRIDEKALRSAPSLTLEPGELVRIDGDAYRRYSAAILTYGEEIIFRVLRGVGAEPPSLSDWERNHTIGS